MAYDVRAIANVVLDRAEHLGISVTNLSINKILYFAHGHFLAHFNKPLASRESRSLGVRASLSRDLSAV